MYILLNGSPSSSAARTSKPSSTSKCRSGCRSLARSIHLRLMSVPITFLQYGAIRVVVVPHSQPISNTTSSASIHTGIVARYSLTPRVAMNSVCPSNNWFWVAIRVSDIDKSIRFHTPSQTIAKRFCAVRLKLRFVVVTDLDVCVPTPIGQRPEKVCAFCANSISFCSSTFRVSAMRSSARWRSFGSVSSLAIFSRSGCSLGSFGFPPSVECMPCGSTDPQIGIDHTFVECHPDGINPFPDVAGTEVIHRQNAVAGIRRVGKLKVVFDFIPTQAILTVGDALFSDTCSYLLIFLNLAYLDSPPVSSDFQIRTVIHWNCKHKFFGSFQLIKINKSY